MKTEATFPRWEDPRPVFPWSAVRTQISWREKLWLAVVALWLVWIWLLPGSALRPLLQLAVFVMTAWVAIRWTRRLLQAAIWSLRNRLLVAYVFVAVVPVVLIVLLAGSGAYTLANQLGVYLVNSEFTRRVNGLSQAARALTRVPPSAVGPATERLMTLLRERYPGIEIALRWQGEGAVLVRQPPGSAVDLPPEDWEETDGLVVRDGRFYAWAHLRTPQARVVVLAPITQSFLNDLVPNLGQVSLISFLDGSAATDGKTRKRVRRTLRVLPLTDPDQPSMLAGPSEVPPPIHALDLEVFWGSPLNASVWDRPGVTEKAILGLHSRVSAILRVFFSQKAEWDQGLLLYGLYALAVLFMVFEAISLFIGVSITRTVTTAVHNLYEGTQRVMRGDFTHRIALTGKDQLADLSRSFNRMTENLERLLAVSKEKERIEAELEIAREVQAQLYPKSVPSLSTLELTAKWFPARTVSGDYFDFHRLDDRTLALSLGDVAGKGISAALLMATVQSSLRSQVRACLETSKLLGRDCETRPSELVSQLNKHLHAFTSPEKYSTFFFAVYDNDTGLFTYTNAGHIPPMLLRNGAMHRLDVNGMVVGAFPFAAYDESAVQLNRGDMLLFFTDGITEPENEYGEMFGEQRLLEVVQRNRERSSGEILEAVLAAVHQWTGSPDLQDDMTILLARRM